MADEDLTRWLDDHGVTLETLEPGRGTADLAPLRTTLSGVRVIGLGEAILGTRELVRCTHRLLEFLVDDLGVRVIALGASEAATVALDEYVAGPQGDLDEALHALADWRWNTRDVLAVVTWLAERNKDAAESDRVRLVGVEPVTAAPAVRSNGVYLSEADPALLEQVSGSLGALLAHRPGRRALAPQVRADVDVLVQRLGTDPAAWAAVTSAPRHARARRYAAALARAAELATTPPDEVDAARERLAAEAIEAIEALVRSEDVPEDVPEDGSEDGSGGGADGVGEGPRVAWWSHARSVRVREEGQASTGALLRRRLDRGYYALGVLMGSGEFRSNRRRRVLGVTRTPVAHRLGPAPVGTVEAGLAGTGDRVVDLRADGAPDGVAAAAGMRALPDPTPIGWKRTVEPVAAAEFDGLVHVARARQAALR